MKNVQLILIVFAVILAGNLAISSISFFKTPKIGFVRSQELVYGYLGMKEAKNIYSDRSQVWQANLDTLKKEFQTRLEDFNKKIKSLSQEERNIAEMELRKRREEILQYSQTVDQQAKEQENKMLEGVLNQINSYVQSYGSKNGYEVILGTTTSGSILYGDNAIDLTNEILLELNSQYKSKL